MTVRAVTLGSDPEIALLDPATSVVVPACDLFGGEKGKPVPVGPEGGWIEDGVAVELNPTAAASALEAQRNVRKLLVAASAHAKTKNLQIMYPVIEHVFRSEDLSNPKSKIFGCAQDLSAYEIGVPREGIMERAMAEVGENVRFYGGHIHVGVTDWPEQLPKFVACRLMDLLLGWGYVREYFRYQNSRDKYYGGAGIYRETAYGIEYRTLTNSWLAEHEKAPITFNRVYEIAQLFANFEKYGKRLVELYNDVDWARFEKAFNARDYKQVDLLLRPVSYQGSSYIQIEDRLFDYASLASVKAAASDKAKNWNLQRAQMEQLLVENEDDDPDQNEAGLVIAHEDYIAAMNNAFVSIGRQAQQHVGLHDNAPVLPGGAAILLERARCNGLADHALAQARDHMRAMGLEIALRAYAGIVATTATVRVDGRNFHEVIDWDWRRYT
jgi:hypothetical protein